MALAESPAPDDDPIDSTRETTLGPKKQRRAALFDERLSSTLPDWFTSGMTEQDKSGYVRRLRKRGGQSLVRPLGMLAATRRDFGYGTPEEELRTYARGQLDQAGGTGTPGVDLGTSPTAEAAGSYARQRLANPNFDDTPTLARMSSYVRERLGTGFTPEELNAFRGQQVEALESQAAEGKRQAAAAYGAAGLGRSPYAARETGKIERERERGRVGIERDLIARNLQRKAEIEALGTSTAGMEAARRGELERYATAAGGLEEQARGMNIDAALKRRAQLEALYGGLSEMGEGRRQFDTGLAEARRQAKINRRLMKQALLRAEPSGLERTSSILGGVLGGLGGS